MTARVFHRDRLPALLRPFADVWEQTGTFDLTVTSGARTDADQLVDWAKGRAMNRGIWVIMDPKAVVTYAQTAINSAHGHDAGADLHPVRTYFGNGAPATIYTGGETEPGVRAEALKRFRAMGEFAERIGFEWGGRFPHFDGPHLQVPHWRDLPLYKGTP